MPQMASPDPFSTTPFAGAPRPLPRRPARVPAGKLNRPRFMGTDAFWTIALPVLLLAVCAAAQANAQMARWPGSLLGAATVAFAFLLGWRIAGRTAGIVSALLLATSLPFALSAPHETLALLFALLTMSALFAFTAGSSLAALALAGLATVVVPDGALLGLTLALLSFAQGRKRAWLGALVFLAIAGGGWAARVWGLHDVFPAVGWHTQTRLLRTLWAAPMGWLLWFLLPLAGEFADPARRARWLPTALWFAVSVTAGSVINAGIVPEGMGLVLLPVLCVLIGGGVARLLPTLAGDVPSPFLRTGLATLAVLLLLALRAQGEWELLSRQTFTGAGGIVTRRPEAPARGSLPKPPAPAGTAVPPKS